MVLLATIVWLSTEAVRRGGPAALASQTPVSLLPSTLDEVARPASPPTHDRLDVPSGTGSTIDFIGSITRYASAHPSTKATTELLFMLDEMVQGSRDTLVALLEIDADRDLWWTRVKNEDAQDLVLILQRHYRAQLERRGMPRRKVWRGTTTVSARACCPRLSRRRQTAIVRTTRAS